jgi:hypothetical protein
VRRVGARGSVGVVVDAMEVAGIVAYERTQTKMTRTKTRRRKPRKTVPQDHFHTCPQRRKQKKKKKKKAATSMMEREEG